SYYEKCQLDISSWMTAHHLKLNPSKTELLFIPSTTGPHRDLAISFGNLLITPTEDARSLGVILDGQLSFSAHIATRSCRFLLYNIRRIRPFLSQEATQLLVQSLVISRLDYCNSLLAGLPLRAIRPLQLVQNAAAYLIFNLPKFTHVTPLRRSLHWLPVVARIRFNTLMLAYKAKNGPAPHYLMAMVKSRAVPQALELQVPALAPVRAVSELVGDRGTPVQRGSPVGNGYKLRNVSAGWIPGSNPVLSTLTHYHCAPRDHWWKCELHSFSTVRGKERETSNKGEANMDIIPLAQTKESLNRAKTNKRLKKGEQGATSTASFISNPY
ncbi:hypothetical protein NFI96_011525, partial [Prochilodus magdalenae]